MAAKPGDRLAAQLKAEAARLEKIPGYRYMGYDLRQQARKVERAQAELDYSKRERR